VKVIEGLNVAIWEVTFVGKEYALPEGLWREQDSRLSCRAPSVVGESLNIDQPRFIM